jgi:hypothetical protein
MDVTTRVVEREANLGGSCETKLVLDSLTRTMDTFEALKKSNEEAARYARAVLAESSGAFEASSSETSLGNRSFRFTGGFFPVGPCGVCWTEGIFKTANASYTLGSGGSYNLDEESTFYFYFNRTSPSAFIFAEDPDEADNDDCILVFTLKTASGETPAIIHPLGIVKG